MRYNIPVLSKNALQKDFLASEDYIISADILRTKIERILKSVAAMAEIPGASAVRMNDQIGAGRSAREPGGLESFQGRAA